MLVWQARSGHDAGVAFGTVNQRGRRERVGCTSTQPGEDSSYSINHRIVNIDANPIARFCESNFSAIRSVAVVTQHEDLQGKLDLLRLPDRVIRVARPTTLQLNRRHVAVGGLNDVDLRDHPERLGGERERCRPTVAIDIRRGKAASLAIDHAMNPFAIDREFILTGLA